MNQLRVVERRRLSDVAFDQLKDAIIREEILPLERIRDAELADRLGLSRTPIREAINRLIEIGLVETKPGSHTRVTDLTQESVTMTLDVLQQLDRLAIESAVPKLTPHDLTLAREINREFAEAVSAQDLAGALRADHKFHQYLREASGNPVLSRVIAQLDPQVQRIMHRKFTTDLGRSDTAHHHDALLQLCASGDAAAAAQFSSGQWSLLGGQIGDLFGAGPAGSVV